MGCCNCKLTLISLIISCLALSLQVLSTSLNDIDEIKNSVIFKLFLCLLNASIAFINALSLGIKQSNKTKNEEDIKVEVEERCKPKESNISTCISTDFQFKEESRESCKPPKEYSKKN